MSAVTELQAGTDRGVAAVKAMINRYQKGQPECESKVIDHFTTLKHIWFHFYLLNFVYNHIF